MGRYELTSMIPSGGASEVYLARDRDAPGRPRVVIKRLPRHHARDPALVAELVAEARTAAQLDHRGIVRVLDIVTGERDCYYVMEHVRGLDLRRVLELLAARGEVMPIECAAVIAIELCVALGYVHEHVTETGTDLLHRDLAPSNVLLGFDGAIKLADFGRLRSRHGAVDGTIGYLSPEQYRGELLDRRSDLFALGLVLYEMTTGRPAFDPELADREIAERTIRGAVAPPSRLRPGYPAELEAIAMCALQPSRVRRYPSARGMQRDLETFLWARRPGASASAVGELLSSLASPRRGPRAPRARTDAERALEAVVDAAVDGLVARPETSLDDLPTTVATAATAARIGAQLRGAPARRSPRRTALGTVAPPPDESSANAETADAPSPRAPSPREPAPRAPSPREPAPRAPSPRAPAPRMPVPQRSHAPLPAPTPLRAHEPRPASAPSGAHDSRQLAPLDARPALAPLDARAASAPLDARAASAPLDARPALAPLDACAALAPLDARAVVAPLDARASSFSPESPGAHEGPPPAQGLRQRPRSLAIAGALVAGLVIAGWAIWRTTHVGGELTPTRHATSAPPPTDPEPAPRRAPRSLRVAPPRAAAAGQGALDATPSIARLEVLGPVPDETVRQAVEGTLDALRGCYRAAARARGITPPAELRLTFELD
ncbi:MAG: protein kinase domain-containing protein, partial [Kofleriaceae bacterium]